MSAPQREEIINRLSEPLATAPPPKSVKSALKKKKVIRPDQAAIQRRLRKNVAQAPTLGRNSPLIPR